MKKKLCTLLAALSFVLCSHISSATVHTITVANFQFTPSSLTIPLGDTIKWVRINGSHTTTSTSIPGSAVSWDRVLDSVSTSFVYVPAVAGVYNYQCTPHASMGMLGTFTVTGGTGVSNTTTLANWSIYPNPTATTLFLRAPVKIMQADIYDYSGRVLRTVKNNSNNVAIDVSPFPLGFYFLHVITENRTEFVRTISVIH